MALNVSNIFPTSQDITVRYEEQRERPVISSKEMVLWHVPLGDGENQTGHGGYETINSSSDYIGQNFTIGYNGPMADLDHSSVKLWLHKSGNPGTITVNLYAVDSSGHPSGSSLGSGTTDGDTLTTSISGEEREVTFSSAVKLLFNIK